MAIGAEAAQSAVKMTRLRTPSTISTADHLSQLVLGSQVLHLLLTGQYAFWLTTLGSQVLHLLLTGYLVAALPQIQIPPTPPLSARGLPAGGNGTDRVSNYGTLPRSRLSSVLRFQIKQGLPSQPQFYFS